MAAWVVVPRVTQRSSLLRAQRTILENKAALPPGAFVTDVSWMGSRPGMMMSDARSPPVERFTTWSIGRTWPRAAFAGGRDAGKGQRIVLAWVDPVIYGRSRAPEITLHIYVIEPGGWTRSPLILSNSVLGPNPLPVPPDSGWRLAVLPGSEGADDASRFLIELEAGYDETPDERRLTVTGFLLPDDTVRIDWPRDSKPANPSVD